MTSEDQTDRIQQLEKRIDALENKQQLSKLSRRGLLGGIAGVAGLGAMSGSGAAASGQVGTANNRVNVFADTVDANTVTGARQGCRVFLSSDQSIAQQSTVKIQFDSKAYDSDNNFDTSSHAWTCPADGLYAVNLQVGFGGGGDDQNRQLRIAEATDPFIGNEGAFVQQTSSDVGDRLSISTVNKYAQGDTIAGFADNRDSGDTLFSGSENIQTFIEVAFLGGL